MHAQSTKNLDFFLIKNGYYNNIKLMHYVVLKMFIIINLFWKENKYNYRHKCPKKYSN